MPHVIVKMYPGRTDEQKARLAEEVTKALVTALGSPETAISVGIEDVEKADWAETVYRPDILDKPDQLYKKPGYDPFA